MNTVAVPRGLDPTTLETAWGLSDVERDGMLILDGTDALANHRLI